MALFKMSSEFSRDFEKLKKRAAKGQLGAQKLLKLIDNAKKELSRDINAGEKIQKNLWPKEYVQKYGINNLWKFNLNSYWRLIYTLIGTKVELIIIYLDFMDHKRYERKFGYKKA